MSLNPAKNFWNALTPHVRQGIQAIFFVTGGILFLLSLGGGAGRAGDAISQGLSLFFGAAKYIFPLLLILWGGALFRYRNEYHLSWISIFGALLFLFSFTAFWHVRFLPEESYLNASAGEGGGLIGFIFAYSLTSVLGFWGTLLVLIALCTSSLLIILNVSLESLFSTLSVMWTAVIRILSGKLHTEKKVQFEREHEEASFPPVPDFSKREVSIKEENPPTSPPKHSLEGKSENGSIQILAPKVKSKIHLSLDLLESVNSQPTSGDILLIAEWGKTPVFGLPVPNGVSGYLTV